MEKPNVILTGFMGTGKTTVGKLLAQQLKYDFIDTDAFIQERAGKTIPQIFEDSGEAVFRKMEADVATELSRRNGVVISTGGRLMLDPDNAATLSSSGRVFCLVATPEEIYERVSRDDVATRPLLAGPDAMGRIVELLQQRREDYNQFPEMVTSGKTPHAITRMLNAIMQANPDLRVPITTAGDRYEVVVGAGLLPFVNDLAGIEGPVAVITDAHVGALYARSCGQVKTVIEVQAAATL